MRSATCQHCGTVFVTRNSPPKGKYCGRDCFNHHRAARTHTSVEKPWISLTRGYSTIVSDTDYPRLATFIWTSHFVGNLVYAITTADGHTVYMHRLLMGAAQDILVDHINGNTLDNRRSNLRLANRQQNAENGASRRGRSGFRGVWEQPRKHGFAYEAVVSVNGRRVSAGIFESAPSAARAWDESKRNHGRTFARANFPEST